MTDNHASEPLSPSRTVRLLRSKEHQLEAQALRLLSDGPSEMGYLNADLALITGLLADHIERTSDDVRPSA